MAFHISLLISFVSFQWFFVIYMWKSLLISGQRGLITNAKRKKKRNSYTHIDNNKLFNFVVDSDYCDYNLIQ